MLLNLVYHSPHEIYLSRTAKEIYKASSVEIPIMHYCEKSGTPKSGRVAMPEKTLLIFLLSLSPDFCKAYKVILWNCR